MNQVRPMAVAGQFYPADRVALTRLLEDCFRKSVKAEINNFPKAIIAPHAGFVYSGPVAASVYQTIQHNNEHIKNIVLLGPSHRVPFRGIALCGADGYASPLGTMPINQSLEAKLMQLPQVGVLAEAHAYEHSLEVQIPFLQTVLPESVSLVPLVVGEATPEMVAEVIRTAWDDDTLVVISSDLSHYLEYNKAKAKDQNTTKAIEALTEKPLIGNEACGCRPINGLLKVAREQHLQVTTLDLRNSGDTAGTKQRVVGYGAYVFTMS